MISTMQSLYDVIEKCFRAAGAYYYSPNSSTIGCIKSYKHFLEDILTFNLIEYDVVDKDIPLNDGSLLEVSYFYVKNIK